MVLFELSRLRPFLWLLFVVFVVFKLLNSFVHPIFFSKILPGWPHDQNANHAVQSIRETTGGQLESVGRFPPVHQCIVGGVVKDAKQLVVFGTDFQQRRYVFFCCRQIVFGVVSTTCTDPLSSFFFTWIIKTSKHKCPGKRRNFKP